eukprot:g4441.t1
MATLLGMGNPLLDISAEVPTETLEKYGVSLNNAILAEDKHQPLYADLVDNFDVQYIAGGATQNSIRVAQWMLGDDDKFKGATAYIGCVGDDKFGAQLTESAQADGVNVHYMKDPEAATGTCAVLVNGGERSLVANLAAANNYKIDHLHGEASQKLVTDAKLVYSAGFFLTVSPESMLEVAQKEGNTFCVNLSAEFIINFFGEKLDAVMPHCDYVFGNETEAATLGEKKGWGKDVAEVALKLAAEPKASATPRIVIFTQGSEKTIVATGQGVVQEFAVEPLAKDKLVDTNGAGDAFVGGFLSGVLREHPLRECVNAGHYAAREVIQRSGCTFPDKSMFEFAG